LRDKTIVFNETGLQLEASLKFVNSCQNQNQTEIKTSIDDCRNFAVDIQLSFLFHSKDARNLDLLLRIRTEGNSGSSLASVRKPALPFAFWPLVRAHSSLDFEYF